MSKAIDFDQPLSDEDKLWLHEWGYDYLIEANEQRFAQAERHDSGEPVDVAGALANAGLSQPVLPESPVLPSNDINAPAEPFDEEAVRIEIADFTVAELRENIKELGGEPEGNKIALQDQLVELLRKI